MSRTGAGVTSAANPAAVYGSRPVGSDITGGICRVATPNPKAQNNIEDFSIWDFVDGVNDVKARRLKMIGDPETRYREDPVRMLRAVRFAAKLDFSIEPNTEGPIRRLAYCWTAFRRRACSTRS